MTSRPAPLHNVGAIYRKEIRGLVDGATFYLATIVFLVLWEFLFFRSVFLVGEDSLRSMFDLLPWLFLVLLPAVTMGSMSRELADGTLEFLLTHAVRDAELVIGKFLAALSYIAVVLLFVVPIALEFASHGSLDWGIVVSQYLAALGMAAVFVALGVFVSSLVRSQVSALLLIVAASFVLVFAGNDLFTQVAPQAIVPVLTDLSVFTHFSSMERGVITASDAWYFVSAILVFLSLAYLQLVRRRVGNRRSIYRSYQIGVTLLVVIALLTNLVGSRIPGRLDLTSEGLFTLSQPTRQIVGHLNDVVNVTLYASGNLPSQLEPVERDVKDTLADYKSLGHGNISIKVVNPSSTKSQQQAESRGVQQVQFNSVAQESYQVKKGFLGISLSYGGQTQAIPFIQDTSDLEYQLTSLISQLTNSKKKTVAFLSGDGEKTAQADYQQLGKELDKQFDVTSASITSKQTSIPASTAVLVVAGPTKAMPSATQSAIKDYLDKGGSMLAMLDGTTLSTQGLSASANTNGDTSLLKPWGVTVNQDLAYDLQANSTASFSSGQSNFLTQYPFWPAPQPSQSSPITRGLEGLTLPWTSTVSVDHGALASKGLTAATVLKTTGAGGTQTGSFNINPEQQPSQSGLGTQTLGVSVQGAKGHTAHAPRLVVIGDSQFATDNFVQRSPSNLVLAQQAVSWLGQEKSLASIEAKGTVVHLLHFKHHSQETFVKWGNMALGLLLPALIGGWRFARRRRRARRVYVPSGGAA